MRVARVDYQEIELAWSWKCESFREAVVACMCVIFRNCELLTSQSWQLLGLSLCQGSTCNAKENYIFYSVQSHLQLHVLDFVEACDYSVHCSGLPHARTQALSSPITIRRKETAANVCVKGRKFLTSATARLLRALYRELQTVGTQGGRECVKDQVADGH